MKQPRYVVTPGGKSGGIQDYFVRLEGQRDFEGAGVWVSEGGSVRCCKCSGPLVAMSASCRHVQAVKRYLAQEETVATGREETE